MSLFDYSNNQNCDIYKLFALLTTLNDILIFILLTVQHYTKIPLKKPNKQWKEMDFKETYCNAEDKISTGMVCIWTVITMIIKETVHAWPAVDITTGWQHIPQELYNLPSFKIRGGQMFSIRVIVFLHCFH